MSDDARAERDAFLARLEGVAGGTVRSAEKFSETALRLGAHLRKIGQQLEELNEHILRFEAFMQSLMETYDDGEDAREALHEMVQDLGSVFRFFRKNR